MQFVSIKCYSDFATICKIGLNHALHEAPEMLSFSIKPVKVKVKLDETLLLIKHLSPDSPCC
jgi:hypothetical protein